MNAKVEDLDGQITGTSTNGKMLTDVLVSYQLHPVNFHPICEGKWTRVQEKAGCIEKSVIDYVFVQTKLWDKILNVEIDEEKLCSPYGLRKERMKDSQTKVYSDHNALVLSLSMTAEKNENKKTDEFTGWKITSEGLNEFQRMTSESCNEGTERKIQVETYKELMQYTKEKMDECFKRKKSKTNKKRPSLIQNKTKIMMILKRHLRRGKYEKKTAMKYIEYLREKEMHLLQEERREVIKKKVSELQNEKGNFSVDKFWKIKKAATWESEEKSSVINKEGVEVFSDDAIIKEYESEFIQRLSHRKIDPVLEEYEERSNELLKMLIEKASMTDEPDFTMEELKKARMSFKNGKTPGPPDFVPAEVLKWAGDEYLEVILNVVNDLKNSVDVPKSWEELLIKTLYKRKGSKKLLENFRGIFLSSVFYKLMEKLIKGRTNKFTSKVNLFQGGSKSGRSCADNMFMLYGVRDHAMYLGASVNFTFYDYRTCFDSIWLEDSMLTLWNLGVRSKLFSLIYKMNLNAKIKIKTSYGISNTIECPRIVKQGTVLGPDLCSSSTAEVSDEKIGGGFSVGGMVTKMLTYVDDTTDVNWGINDTISSHSQTVFFSKKKRQGLNYKKCLLLMLNRKPTDSVPTLMVDGHAIKVVGEAKVLGDVVNDKGNNKSLVLDRAVTGNSVLISSISLCSEVSVGKYSLEMMLLMYETVFLQAVLFNSQAWSNLRKAEIEILQVAQLKFLKRTMKVPGSATNSGVFLELGILPIKHEINKRQLNFLHHILSLSSNDPVLAMYQQQQLFPYEVNWANTIKLTAAKYGIKLDENLIKSMSRDKWKNIVDEKVEHAAFCELLIENANKSKTNDLQYEKLEVQGYIAKFNTEVACVIFRYRIRSIKCKANQKSSYSDLTCRLCQSTVEDQHHVANCEMIREDGPEIDTFKLRRKEEEWDIENNDLFELARRVKRFDQLCSEKVTC